MLEYAAIPMVRDAADVRTAVEACPDGPVCKTASDMDSKPPGPEAPPNPPTDEALQPAAAPSGTVHKRSSRQKLIAGTIVIFSIIGAAVALKLRGSVDPNIARVRNDFALIQRAMDQFRIGYNGVRQPMSAEIISAGSPDFVFGTIDTGTSVEVLNGGSEVQANNSHLLSVLLAATTFPNGKPTPNADNKLNPDKRQLAVFQTTTDPHGPGLGPDGVLRDPWGNPYIIAVDLSGDFVTESWFKNCEKPPKLEPSSITGEVMTQSDYFCVQLQEAIWSFGPDGKADPSLKVSEGVNADNIYSWRFDKP